jgi:hypothetical protein
MARQDEPIYAKSIAELESLSDHDLAEQNDKLVGLGKVSVCVRYYLRRVVMTGFIAVLTVINVVAVIVGLSG